MFLATRRSLAHKPPLSTDFLRNSREAFASPSISDANAIAAAAPLTPLPPSANDVFPWLAPDVGAGASGCVCTLFESLPDTRPDSIGSGVAPRAAAAAAAEITEARPRPGLSRECRLGPGDPGEPADLQMVGRGVMSSHDE